MTADDKLNELGQLISDHISGADLNFALVLWMPGKQQRAQSLAIASSRPDDPDVVAQALNTAATVLVPALEGEQEAEGLKTALSKLVDVVEVLAQQHERKMQVLARDYREILSEIRRTVAA